MVFIDGTNLFYRLRDAKLRVPSLKHIVANLIGSRQIVRMYLYTVAPHLADAKKLHGEKFLEGIRVVPGLAIETRDGNIKEKGVDALLVADMIYHAASKNCEYALVVTVDQDFVYVLRRVEDFGCKSAVLSICAQAPERLRDACDEYYEIGAEDLLKKKLAVRHP